MRFPSCFRTGATLSATVAVGYALCTAVFAAWPDAAANFMNALFHGLDFRKLQAGTSLFSFGAFAYAEIVLSAWAFGLGVLYGWIADRIGLRDSSAMSATGRAAQPHSSLMRAKTM